MSTPARSLRIPVPCPVEWDRMYGDAGIRHCPICDKNVYRLAALPQAVVDQVLGAVAGGEKPCIRVYVRPDGTVKTSGCDTARTEAPPADPRDEESEVDGVETLPELGGEPEMDDDPS